MRVIGQASPAVGREPFELVGSLRWLPGDIPPVHVVDQSGPFACPCQVIRPGASPAGGTVANPTADIPGTATPCLKDPIETLPRVSNDRAGSTGTGSSRARGSGPTQTTAGTLIACHSIRPVQAGAAIAGRIIRHRTGAMAPTTENVPDPPMFR